MSETQRQAMRVMAEHNAGAVFAGGRWVWRETVRQSEEAAEAVVRWGQAHAG